jgi:hypothetical protein
MLTRWQGVPAEAELERMIRDVSLVKISEIPGDIARIDLDGRRTQIAERAHSFAQRTSERGWTDAS